MPGNPRNAAFTLIELIAAMAVLLMMVLFLSRLFTSTSNVLGASNRKLDASSTGRAIMEIITRDLSQSIARSNVSFVVYDDLPSGAERCGTNAFGIVSDEIYFVAAAPPGARFNLRTSSQTAYYIAPMLQRQSSPPAEIPFRYSLVRAQAIRMQELGTDGAYRNENWPAKMPSLIRDDHEVVAQTVADNVVSFNVLAYAADGNPAPGYHSVANQYRLPLWLDISLEVLAPSDAAEVATRWSFNQSLARDLINQKTRRYTARVYFPNRDREGWGP